MKEVTFNVPDMQSTHCQTRVNNVVKDIEGVQIKNLEAGKITISITNDNKSEEIVTVIEKAGYNVSPDSNPSSCSCCKK